MLLYAAVTACAVLAACLVYRYDLYDREPVLYLGLTALVGAASMFLTGRLELETIAWLIRVELASSASLAAVGATHEEIVRFAVLWILSLAFGKEFNDPMDGLVYGSVLGLGMGLEESVHTIGLLGQVVSTDGIAWLHLPVELVRLLGHLVMGGITGFGLGLKTIPIADWKRRALGCLFVSMLIHFSWDWIALVAPRAQFMSWWQVLVAIQVMVFGMLFYGMLVVVGSDWSKKEFAPHSLSSLWGWPFSVWMRRPTARPPDC